MNQTKLLLAIILLASITNLAYSQKNFGVDQVLSDWGPYTYRYAGVSNIADAEKGLSFDLSVFPVTPGQRNLPFENGGHTNYTYWAARPKLEDYTLRFIMDPKRMAWCDVSYFEQDEASHLFRVDIHNQSGSEWEGDLHMLAHLRYPPKIYSSTIRHEPLRIGNVELPDKTAWMGSLDYEDLHLARPDSRDALPERGLLRREEREHGSVGGSLLGRGFGQAKGDAVVYRFTISQNLNNAVLLLRGRSDGEQEASFTISGISGGHCTFPLADELSLLNFPAGNLEAGNYELRLESNGTGSVLFDGFTVMPEDLVNGVKFTIQEPNAAPVIETIGEGRGLILKYQGVEQYYGYAIALPQGGAIRSLLWKELYQAFGEDRKVTGEDKILGGGRWGKGDPLARFIDLGFTPEPVQNGTDRQYWGMVCRGGKSLVISRLEEFMSRPAREYESRVPFMKMLPPYNEDGKQFAFYQQLLTASTAMNVIYPQLHERRYSIGYTPAKLWGVAYTWDNGIHGIGLNIIDTDLSAALMYQMTTAPGAETPYIWGGSPMPMQFYQFREWWNLCQDRESMEILYPRLKQMYEWFIGRSHGSNTRGPAKDGLISTYEYFYNLGWDDYPGHTFASMSKNKGWPAPVCQSVHTLIGARALSHAARELGLKKDVAVYESDARILEKAILEDAWDGESGYYGYVSYDHESGEKLGIIRGQRKKPSNVRPHQDKDNLEVYIAGNEGVNINMGLDGTSPWYAGLGSPQQRAQQFKLLTTEGRLWTSIGLLTVDLKSPFSCPGYWIDRAWIPPQWWYWKGALDQGKGDFAFRLANVVLNNAMRTAEEKWDTYENYSYSEMKPGGTGLNFAGLATPALDFFYSYYVPGTLSFGHDAWVGQREWSGDKNRVRAMVRFDQERPGETRLISACFSPGGSVKATWKGRDVPVEKVTEGGVHVRIPCRKERGELIISRNDE